VPSLTRNSRGTHLHETPSRTTALSVSEAATASFTDCFTRKINKLVHAVTTLIVTTATALATALATATETTSIYKPRKFPSELLKARPPTLTNRSESSKQIANTPRTPPPKNKTAIESQQKKPILSQIYFPYGQ